MHSLPCDLWTLVFSKEIDNILQEVHTALTSDWEPRTCTRRGGGGGEQSPTTCKASMAMLTFDPVGPHVSVIAESEEIIN